MQRFVWVGWISEHQRPEIPLNSPTEREPWLSTQRVQTGSPWEVWHGAGTRGRGPAHCWLRAPEALQGPWSAQSANGYSAPDGGSAHGHWTTYPLRITYTHSPRNWSPLNSFKDACRSCQSGMWLQYTHHSPNTMSATIASCNIILPRCVHHCFVWFTVPHLEHLDGVILQEIMQTVRPPISMDHLQRPRAQLACLRARAHLALHACLHTIL